MSKIREAAEACFDEIVEIRRDIHRHPETGWKEVRTSALIQEKLREYGVDSIENPAATAVVALIHGALGPGKCVALRADMDALPMPEDTGLPFASETANVMHACGHDMHVSMLLGVAKMLCGMRDQFSGTVKLIFQHAEDVQPGGAKELVKAGVMENPHVDAIFALHMMPHENLVGKVALRSGPITSAVDQFKFTIVGRGGHGSEPHKTDDPILAAGQLIVALQQIVARRIDPMETGIYSLGSVHSGDAPNVIPGEAVIGGVCRAFSDEVRTIMREQTFNIVKGIESISSCNIDLEYNDGYPVCYNDPGMVQLAREAISEELGSDAVVELERPMGFSEDFASYGQMTGTPSAYLMLYGGCGEEGVFPLHNSKCCFREEAMTSGMRVMANIALTYLKG